jgi:thiamine kinase-like enzyme
MLSIERKIASINEFKKLDIDFIKEVQHGTINTNFVISTTTKNYFLRLNNPSVAGVNRKLEAEILKRIKPLNITPEIIVNNISEGYLIMEYLNVNHWSSEQCLNSQNLLLEPLSKIHQIELSNHFPSLLSRLEVYERQSKAMLDKLFFSSYLSNKQALQKLGFFAEKKLVHFDLNSKNLLGADPVKIIDWEFAGSAHPIYDCALFIYYNDLSLKECALIIEYCNNYASGEVILELALKLAKDMTTMWEMIEKKHLPNK